jgi:DNA-binding NtrC family response regulator
LQGAETVVMSAEGDLSSALDVLRKGALDYLAKPFELEDLASLLAGCKRSEVKRVLQPPRAIFGIEQAH